jgi:integrase/recombinase XerD
MNERTEMNSRNVGLIGPLADHAPGFRKALAERRYSDRSISTHCEAFADLDRWLDDEGLALADLTSERVARFLESRRRRGKRYVLSSFGIAPELSYLEGLGVLPAAQRPLPVGPEAAVRARYRAYLTDEKAMAAHGVVRYEQVAALFVSSLAGAEESVDWSSLSAAHVTRFVVKECATRRGSAARNLAAGLRAFLRFLQLEGLTDLPLASAVPSVAGRRGASVPEGISPQEVVRLLESCDRERAVGRRDYAILTVLVRLGLRTSEVAGMQLEDIDWRGGEIVVHGKGRRDQRLPLPHDVGTAIADYLRRGRAQTASRSVFLRKFAPWQALTPTGVTGVVYQACDRSGLPRIAAHRLRHTAATEMLRAGASLSEVAQVLRHERMSTSAIYAKVDHESLRTLARPWPGGAA